MNIYICSSWNNPYRFELIQQLERFGHQVYDFQRYGTSEKPVLTWKDIQDETLDKWNPPKPVDGGPPLEPIGSGPEDWINWAEIGVLLLPAGRNSHIEFGLLAARKIPVFILDTKGLPVQGHSNNDEIACSVCGDADGCHMPNRTHPPEILYKLGKVCSIKEFFYSLGCCRK